MFNGSLYGNFRNLTFTEVWDSYDKFLDDLKECEIPLYDNTNDSFYFKEDHIRLTFYLCYARYGNSVIAPSDINRFKYAFFSIMYTAGPTWSKKVEIQDRLRNLTESELLKSSKEIYNHAFNPSTEPSTSSIDELSYINEQNTTNRVRSVLDGYNFLLDLLSEDVSNTYLTRFKKLFLTVVYPEEPLWYSTINEEDENA